MVLYIILHRSQVTAQQVVGYGIALCGVTAYNMHKLHRAQPSSANDAPKTGRASPSPKASTADSAEYSADKGANAVVKVQQPWPQDAQGQQGVLRDQCRGWKLFTAVAESHRHKVGVDDSYCRSLVSP